MAILAADDGGDIGTPAEIEAMITSYLVNQGEGGNQASKTAYDALMLKFRSARGSLAVYTDELLTAFDDHLRSMFHDTDDFPTWWMDDDSLEWRAKLSQLYLGYETAVLNEQKRLKAKDDTIMGRSAAAGRPINSYIPNMISRLAVIRFDTSMKGRLPLLTVSLVLWMSKAFSRVKDAIYEACYSF